jgi:hypothetical protein
LDVSEIGLFGSRVYKEVINETCPSLKMPNNPRADLDIYCISGKLSSSGIFAFCHEELGSRENFREIINEFNKKNPNLQISFLEDEDGKKSVNFNRLKKSLNFKLVATFFEDEVGEEKTEKTVKEKVEFDLNFYTQQSMLENLQWQFNLERVFLAQNPDRTFALKINQQAYERYKVSDNVYKEYLDILRKQDFDVGIFGTGYTSLLLTAECKRMGKAGIHLGGSTQILFGVKGQRWREIKEFQSFFNEHWTDPLESEKPENRKICENGCYW